jgi:hypothetical protein
MRYQSLLDAYRHGGLHLDRARDVFVLTTDLDLVPRVRQAYLQAMQDRPDLPTVKESYHYFLEEGIGRLYVAGRRTEARQLFEELRERAPETVEDRPFTEFAWNAFLAEEAAWNRTQPEEVLTELLYQSLLRSKLNEPQAGQALYTSAVELHARWKPLYPALPDLTETEHRAARHLRQTFPQLFE